MPGKPSTTRHPAPVFISHASEDAALAAALVEWLEEAGVDCWISPRDIMASESYPDALERGVEESRAVLILLTAEAVAKEGVLDELVAAKAHHKPIVGVRVGNYKVPDGVMHLIRRLQLVTLGHLADVVGNAQILETLSRLGPNDRTVGVDVDVVGTHHIAPALTVEPSSGLLQAAVHSLTVAEPALTDVVAGVALIRIGEQLATVRLDGPHIVVKPVDGGRELARFGVGFASTAAVVTENGGLVLACGDNEATLLKLEPNGRLRGPFERIRGLPPDFVPHTVRATGTNLHIVGVAEGTTSVLRVTLTERRPRVEIASMPGQWTAVADAGGSFLLVADGDLMSDRSFRAFEVGLGLVEWTDVDGAFGGSHRVLAAVGHSQEGYLLCVFRPGQEGMVGTAVRCSDRPTSVQVARDVGGGAPTDVATLSDDGRATVYRIPELEQVGERVVLTEADESRGAKS